LPDVTKLAKHDNVETGPLLLDIDFEAPSGKWLYVDSARSSRLAISARRRTAGIEIVGKIPAPSASTSKSAVMKTGSGRWWRRRRAW
jgi:hypothetical protein